MSDLNMEEKEVLDQERLQLLEQFEEWLEMPVVVLGFVWLVLLVIELIWGLNPLLNAAVYTIWIIFVIDFAIRFVLAPDKLRYLRINWLTALSLALPALRVFRIARLVRVLRLARATRSLRLIKVVGSLNRGMRALRASLSRRGVGYAFLLTLLVTLVGAAGMYAFETQPGSESGLNSYGEALWWTAMIMTTLGSDYWLMTAEGRILAFLLAVYAFAIFGYVTATLATFFIGREATEEEGELASAQTIQSLRAEIAGLRAEIRRLAGQ